MDFSRFFYRQADFRRGAVDFNFYHRVNRYPTAAGERISGCRPAERPGARGYPGANPKVIAETVATPLEEAINGVENMMYMKSVAGSDGVLVTTVTFRPGTDPDQAQVQVQNRVAQAEARLPEDVCAVWGSPPRSSLRR